MKKNKFLLLLFSMILIFALGCSPVEETKEAKPNEVKVEQVENDKIVEDVIGNVLALKGPTGMGMVEMIENDLNAEKPGYNFSITGAVDEIVPSIVQGKVDIAAVPANLGSVIYNKTNGEVVSLGVNTLGVLYIVENGNSINSIEDLKGKTIYMSGKGATPEYALNHILKNNSIEDLNIEFKSEHTEVLASLLNDENGVALLPEPFVTTSLSKNENLRVAIDLNKEWEKITGSGLITGIVIARKEFVDNNPNKVKDFLDKYKKSVDFVNDNIEESSKLIEKNNIVPASVAKVAIPRCNITLIEGNEMKEKLSSYLEILNTENPQSVGGKLPGENFYYVR